MGHSSQLSAPIPGNTHLSTLIPLTSTVTANIYQVSSLTSVLTHIISFNLPNYSVTLLLPLTLL